MTQHLLDLARSMGAARLAEVGHEDAALRLAPGHDEKENPMAIPHTEPIVGPDPGSPPPEPKFREPTRGEIEAVIRLSARDLLRHRPGDRPTPFIVAVHTAIGSLDLGELLTAGLHESDLVRINDDVVLELAAEIRGILKTIPAEDWPV